MNLCGWFIMKNMNEKKYIIAVGDGMADRPVPELGGKTPLEYADTPNLDFLAKNGVFGLARTVPQGMSPGSDTANLSIFGYDPRTAYTGRAPLEALNMGIELGPRDVAFRCNLVDLKDGIMHDFTAGHIESALSEIVMSALRENIRLPGIEFHAGVSYRNSVIWRDYPYDEISGATPPHDISGRAWGDYLPSGKGSDVLREIMERSVDIIAKSAAVAEAKKKLHGNPVSAWMWGGGFRPNVEPISLKYNLRGATVSAVDLIHGIGRAAGFEPLHVEGVTGYVDTNYEGKAEAALEFLSGRGNCVYVHVESPDETGHQGDVKLKVKSIEDFDKRTLGPLLKGSERFADCTILCMPDHPTPIEIMTHAPEPVPFAIYRKQGFASEQKIKAEAFTEKEAAKTGLYIDAACVLMGALVKGEI
jgi:2,3-bisphosphoglycerate-independent phosphoglycerate mutase